MKISTIVPCYNQAHYLAETLDSIIAQTHSNWECVIVNDGATDETEFVAKSYLQKDPRIKYIYKKNGGLASARNAGIKAASGQWILFLDSDDHIEPTKFEDSLAAFENDKELKIILSDFNMFVDTPSNTTPAFCKLKQELFTFHNILFEWDRTFSIPIHCGLFDAALFSKILFNESLKAKEDWVMWIEVFRTSPKVFFLNKKLSNYRDHPVSMTKDAALMLKYEVEAYKYIVEYLPENYAKAFANSVVDRLYYTINAYKSELSSLQNNRWVKLGKKTKSTLREMSKKLRGN